MGSSSGRGARAGGARPRATDVAARARVSVATVSLVINGKSAGRVSERTRIRVEKAVAELGYFADPTARSLATGRRNCVALVAPDVGNPFISQVASGVRAGLGADYRLLLEVPRGEPDGPDLDQLVAFGVDGILLDYTGARAPAVDLGCPVILLDEPAGPPHLSSISFDTGPGACELVDRLVGLGHRHVAYLDSAREGSTFDVRRRQVLNRLGRTEGTTVTRVRADLGADAARALVAGSLSTWSAAGVTAVIAASDVLAYGALAALAAAGVAVPSGMSVGSFDDLPFSGIVSPALTTVRLSAFDLGRTSARLLRDLLDEDAPAPRHESLSTSLQVRASLGPARGGAACQEEVKRIT